MVDCITVFVPPTLVELVTLVELDELTELVTFVEVRESVELAACADGMSSGEPHAHSASVARITRYLMSVLQSSAMGFRDLRDRRAASGAARRSNARLLQLPCRRALSLR